MDAASSTATSTNTPPSPRPSKVYTKSAANSVASTFFPTIHQTVKSRQQLQQQQPASSSSSSLLPAFSSGESSATSSRSWDDEDTLGQLPQSYSASTAHLNPSHRQRSGSSLLGAPSHNKASLPSSTSLPHLSGYAPATERSPSTLLSRTRNRNRSTSPNSGARQLSHALPPLPRSPRQLHPHDMADFDDEPVVPRSSKQAKMLGVGVDHNPASSSSAARGRAGDASDGGLQSWNGWGPKSGVGAAGDGYSSPRQDSAAISPWGQGASSSDVSRPTFRCSKSPLALLTSNWAHRIARVSLLQHHRTFAALAAPTLSVTMPLLRRRRRRVSVWASSSARPAAQS